MAVGPYAEVNLRTGHVLTRLPVVGWSGRGPAVATNASERSCCRKRSRSARDQGGRNVSHYRSDRLRRPVSPVINYLEVSLPPTGVRRFGGDAAFYFRGVA